MKVPIFFFLALCISKAAAFGLYGCYERVMYWQAYQMDADSDERLIAKACASNSEVQSALGKIANGRCNLRQFLYYIAASDKEKGFVKQLKDTKLAEGTTVDKLANILYDGHIGSQYKCNVIYQGVAKDDIPTLFKAVGKFIGQNNNSKNNALVQQALKARVRVAEGRVAGRNRDVGDLLREKYDPEHHVPNRGRDPPMITEGLVPEVMTHSDGKGWPTVDLYDAKKTIEKANPQDGKVNIQSFINKVDEAQQKGDGNEKRGHKPNIEAITEAKSFMTNGFCAK